MNSFMENPARIWEPWRRYKRLFSAGAYIINRKVLQIALKPFFSRYSTEGSMRLLTLCQKGQVCHTSDLLADFLLYTMTKSYILTVPIVTCGLHCEKTTNSKIHTGQSQRRLNYANSKKNIRDDELTKQFMSGYMAVHVKFQNGAISRIGSGEITPPSFVKGSCFNPRPAP